MSKRLTTLFVLFACLVPVAQGQDTRIYLNTGVAFPMGPGDVGEFWGRGLTLDLTMGRRVGDLIELTVGLGRGTMQLREDKLVAVGVDLDVSGGTFSIGSLVGAVRIEFERGTWFRPYLHLGAGLHRVSVSDLTLTILNAVEVCVDPQNCELRFNPAERPTETALGLRLGAGIAYYLTDRLWFYAEPNYHIIFSDESVGMVPLRLGIARAF